MKTGDAIAKVAQPIAKTIDYWLGTDIQNCIGCKKMQQDLNAGVSLGDAFYDRFFRKPNQQQKEE
jgi:hypothetical protein